MVKATEDDLFALAAEAGKEGSSTEDGLPLKPIFLGPESGRIDDGFETRVKPPENGRRGRPSKTGDTKQEGEKKAVGRPRGSAPERTLADVADALEEKFAVIFGLLTPALPVTGTYGVEKSPKAIKALLNIAKRRPAVMKALLTVADGADALEIGTFAAGLAVAMQVDMQRLPADAMPARATGVTAVVEKYFMTEDEPTNPNVTEQVTHASPRFQPVS